METFPNVTKKFLNPSAILGQLDIKTGDVVADFGCGPGYFSLPLAEAVGEEGKIYAFDVLEQSLETVEGKAKNGGLTNIVIKRVNLESEKGSKLKGNVADWVILKDILFQNQKKDLIIKEAQRILKQGGRVLLIEWNSSDFTIGPDRDMRVNESELKKIFEELGFFIERSIDAGSFHYAFVAQKK